MITGRRIDYSLVFTYLATLLTVLERCSSI
jgi:hypothetical protein